MCELFFTTALETFCPHRKWTKVQIHQFCFKQKFFLRPLVSPEQRLNDSLISIILRQVLKGVWTFLFYPFAKSYSAIKNSLSQRPLRFDRDNVKNLQDFSTCENWGLVICPRSTPYLQRQNFRTSTVVFFLYLILFPAPGIPSSISPAFSNIH